MLIGEYPFEDLGRLPLYCLAEWELQRVYIPQKGLVASWAEVELYKCRRFTHLLLLFGFVVMPQKAAIWASDEIARP